DEVWQRIAKAADVRRGDHGVSRDLTLEDEVPLVDLRELEVSIEKLHGANRWVGGGQEIRVDRHERAIIRTEVRSRGGAGYGQVRRAGRELPLTQIDADARVDQCIVYSRVDYATVINAPTATQAGFAVSAKVVSETDARAEIVLVADSVRRLRQQ